MTQYLSKTTQRYSDLKKPSLGKKGGSLRVRTKGFTSHEEMESLKKSRA